VESKDCQLAHIGLFANQDVGIYLSHFQHFGSLFRLVLMVATLFFRLLWEKNLHMITDKSLYQAMAAPAIVDPRNAEAVSIDFCRKTIRNCSTLGSRSSEA
jgi:hypothetical protein